MEDKAPAPFGTLPTARQLRWHALEYYGFLHFTTNTFTDREWGYGDEDTAIFNPTEFDADALARTAREVGMKGLLLTAKHHDGFCLWPTKTTDHSVKNSPFRNGKGDVVKEVADACRKHKLLFGVYLSPWDRNHPAYGTPEYVGVYRAQLRELMSDYGPLFEIWHDGANGGDGYYGGKRETRRIDKTRYYDWPTTWQQIRELQPNAVVFSDAGPDIRWVGNERGIAGEPCWATINGDDIYPGREGVESRLNQGERGGSRWIGAECDVSIRPGWFWHEAENNRVKTPAQLLDLYFASVGRGASLLLNVPPDRRGRWHENDIASLREFHQLREQLFAVDASKGARLEGPVREGFPLKNLRDGKPNTYWATEDSQLTPEVTVTLKQAVPLGAVRLREFLPMGLRVDEFVVDVWDNGTWSEWARGTGIGNQRLLRGRALKIQRLRLRITKAAVCPCLSEFSVFAAATVK